MMKVISVLLLFFMTAVVYAEKPRKEVVFQKKVIDMKVAQQLLLPGEGFQRVFVKETPVVDAMIIEKNRQIVLTAKKSGKTTIKVWFSDGKMETYELHVEKLIIR